MPFEVILNAFAQMLQNSKNATLSSEMLVLGGVGPPFWHHFCLLFECFFLCCFLDGLFARFWRIWASKKGLCWGPFWQFLQILHETERAEIEVRKLMIFGRLLGGAGGRGEACLSLQILQSMVSGFNHALLPLRGCGESRVL